MVSNVSMNKALLTEQSLSNKSSFLLVILFKSITFYIITFQPITFFFFRTIASLYLPIQTLKLTIESLYHKYVKYSELQENLLPPYNTSSLFANTQMVYWQQHLWKEVFWKEVFCVLGEKDKMTVSLE